MAALNILLIWATSSFPRTHSEAQQWIDGRQCEQDWVRAFVQAVMKPRVL